MYHPQQPPLAAHMHGRKLVLMNHRNLRIQTCTGVCQVLAGVLFGIAFLLAASKTYTGWPIRRELDDTDAFMRWSTWYTVQGLCTLTLNGLSGCVVVVVARLPCMTTVGRLPAYQAVGQDDGIQGFAASAPEDGTWVALTGICTACEASLLGLIAFVSSGWLVLGCVLALETGINEKSTYFLILSPMSFICGCVIGILQCQKIKDHPDVAGEEQPEHHEAEEADVSFLRSVRILRYVKILQIISNFADIRKLFFHAVNRMRSFLSSQSHEEVVLTGNI